MIRSIDVMTIFHNKFTEIEANCTIDQQTFSPKIYMWKHYAKQYIKYKKISRIGR